MKIIKWALCVFAAIVFVAGCFWYIGEKEQAGEAGAVSGSGLTGEIAGQQDTNPVKPPKLYLKYKSGIMPHKKKVLFKEYDWGGAKNELDFDMLHTAFMTKIDIEDTSGSIKLEFSVPPQSYEVMRVPDKYLPENADKLNKELEEKFSNSSFWDKLGMVLNMEDTYKKIEEEFKVIETPDGTIDISRNTQGYVYMVSAAWEQGEVYYAFYVK
ncbi:MAG: hypothetical protein FWF05_08350 [Oscillospiraceae bacterium]|nr:hypothetical protein [Oscillospiraceae bacterium]